MTRKAQIMKTWWFTEAAYPHLPDHDSIDSVRVTLPNSVIDPRQSADLWHRYLDFWLAAEANGFGIMLNEHHSTATCVSPAVPIIAGILARQTTTAPILVLGNPIANRPDPIRVAEEMALVDVLSRGRLVCGFVRGVPYEVAAANVRPINMTDRFWEAHDLILKAWTTHDGPFSWTGEFFEHRQVNIWPRPYQDPHPPVWVSTLNPMSTKPIAEHGYTMATFLLGKDGTRVVFDAYRQYRRECGGEYSPDQLAYCGLVFVGETEREARAGAEQLMWYVRANKVPLQFAAPVGYMPPAVRATSMSTGNQDQANRHKSMDELIEAGTLFAGTPDQVLEQISNFYDGVGGFGNFLMMGQAGFLGPEETLKSMRLFADEVKPGLDALVAGDRVTVA